MADDEHGHFSVVFVASGHGVYKFLSGLNLNYLQDGIHFANSDLTIGRQVPKIPDYCAQIPPEAAVDSNGYRQGALKGGGVAFVSRSGESASQPACIVCSKITEWTCRESIPDANSRVRMDVAWWQHDFKSSPDWTEIDSAARRFVNTILPFRDNSDFK
jgi:hypothetical protein